MLFQPFILFRLFRRQELPLELIHRANPGNPDVPDDEPGCFVIWTPPVDRDMKRALVRTRQRDGSVEQKLLFPPMPELVSIDRE